MSAIKIYTCSICELSHEVGTACPKPEAQRSLAAMPGSAKLDPETVAFLKPILEMGDDAISNRGQFQKLIVEIAMALGVPCDNCKSEIVHAQYMEIGERIKQRISPNESSSATGGATTKGNQNEQSK